MSQNLIGLFLSYGLIVLLLATSTLLSQLKVADEFNRKSIHMGVSFWWLIAMTFFNDVWIAMIPPFSFLIANLISRRYQLIRVMERKHSRDLGTIYYPISMLILTWYSFGILDMPQVGAIGIFIMGFGDALAAIVGKKWGSIRIYGKKTLLGSTTMFVVSFLVSTIIISHYHPNSVVVPSLIIASVATLLELYSPRGIDNLTVPLLTSLIYYYMFFC